MEGVRGIRLLEGEVALGEGEVIGDGLVPLLGAEAHLVVGGVGDPCAGAVGHGEGEAGRQPRGFDEDGAGARRHLLGVLHRHRELRAAVPRRRRRRGRRHGRRCRAQRRGDAAGRAHGHGSAVGDGCAAHGRPVDRPMMRPACWRVCALVGGFRTEQTCNARCTFSKVRWLYVVESTSHKNNFRTSSD